ncbi:pyridoxal-phosphate dependent enzyme [Vulcanisaeta distributa]|uniref:pyridoxal-phosphate dependent enzyme n=1 Tax=Vulcanisaeta distributa TaxID=164451 RepID=UPI000AC9B976|nr:pyridoxal-phosphate dependent enzyme [Vulcanisaeta distributa]
MRFRCLRCGYVGLGNGPSCPRCGFPLIAEPRGVLRIDREKPSILRYASALNYGDRVVTLGEGFTRIRRVNGVLIKDESRNPTGSFMDRGSSVLISNAVGEIRVLFEEDFTLSIATYANAAGVSAKVYVNPDRVGAYAELLRLSTMGNVTIEFGGGHGINTFYGEPIFLDGVKTIAYELYEQVGEVEGVVLPMERGYLALAVYEGFRELREWGFIGDLPRLILVKHRAAQMTEISDWLVRAAGARVVDVSDEETIRSMIELARSGMYVKPVSAMAYAAASTLGGDYVVVITGTGIKEYRVGRELGGLTKLQEAILGVLEGSRPLTAYEVWERLGGVATIQGVYKALGSLVRRGLVSLGYEVRGNKKVRVYRSLSNYK